MYTASFYGDEVEYPRYTVGDDYPTQQDALLACEADLRKQAKAGRKYYNDLCYYDITEALEDGERGDTVNAAELPDLNLPSLGDFVRVTVRGKVRHGEIIAVEPSRNRGYFIVAELLKRGTASTSRNRWHYFYLSALPRVTVYRRFKTLTPTPGGPTWMLETVPVK